MNTKWFPLFGLILGATEPNACDDKGLEKRPPVGENGVRPDGVHYENPPATTNAPATQTPTVSATVGVPGASVTVTAPVPTSTP